MPTTSLRKTLRLALATTLLAAVMAIGMVETFHTWRYLHRIAPPSVQAVNRPLVEFSVDPSWIKSGTPKFSAVETVRSPDGRSISGLWACDGPTTFEWTFGLDETVHLLEGRVDVHYFDRRFTLLPGDTATFHAGTKAVWHVPAGAKKAFTLHHPGRWVMLWRSWFPA